MGDEEAKTEEKKGWLESLMDRAKQFWPLSLLLMALTLLSRFEDLQTWSAWLSFVVDHWRWLMKAFWEFWLNLVRKIFGLSLIHLEPPIPAILTFFGLLATAIRSSSKVSKYLNNFFDVKIPGDKRHFLILFYVCTIVGFTIYFYITLFSSYIAPVLLFFGIGLTVWFSELEENSGNHINLEILSKVLLSLFTVSSLALLMAWACLLVATFLELLIEYLAQIFDHFNQYRETKGS